MIGISFPPAAYSSNEHGVSLTTFFNRVDKYEPTVIVVRTSNMEVSPGDILSITIFSGVWCVLSVIFVNIFQGVWGLLFYLLGPEEPEG